MSYIIQLISFNDYFTIPYDKGDDWGKLIAENLGKRCAEHKKLYNLISASKIKNYKETEYEEFCRDCFGSLQLDFNIYKSDNKNEIKLFLQKQSPLILLNTEYFLTQNELGNGIKYVKIISENQDIDKEMFKNNSLLILFRPKLYDIMNDFILKFMEYIYDNELMKIKSLDDWAMLYAAMYNYMVESQLFSGYISDLKGLGFPFFIENAYKAKFGKWYEDENKKEMSFEVTFEPYSYWPFRIFTYHHLIHDIEIESILYFIKLLRTYVGKNNIYRYEFNIDPYENKNMIFDVLNSTKK